MRIAVSLWLLLHAVSSQAGWKLVPTDNPDGPGKAIDVHDGDRLVARFVHGEGQIKPYLHVFGDNGELLTNAGADKNGKATGAFPHHRGIFIGWKIESELGTDDLWHMTKGCRMAVATIDQAVGGNDSARIVATVLWKSARSTNGSDVLITERRELIFSRPATEILGGKMQIDATFTLTPARNLRLAGDLQHSGVHFRASNEVHGRQSETSYVTSPDGKAKGNDLKWCGLSFPIGTNFYSAVQLNHPLNPVEELSTRKYGRFGYFFKKDLTKDKPLALKYRFLIAISSDHAKRHSVDADAAYAAFVK
jgi:hypothetical protein